MNMLLYCKSAKHKNAGVGYEVYRNVLVLQKRKLLLTLLKGSICKQDLPSGK